MSKAAGSEPPKVEDLTAARDAALECVTAAEDYWSSIVALPPIDPAIAGSVRQGDLAAIVKAQKIEPNWVRLGVAIAAFDNLPSVVLAALDVAAIKNAIANVGVSPHREARDLASEFHQADRHVELDPTRRREWAQIRELTRWRRVRELVPPGPQATRRWNDLVVRINRTHQLVIASPAPVTSKQRRRRVPKDIALQGRASELCKLLQREECDQAGRSLDDMLRQAGVVKNTFYHSSHFREARDDWERLKTARGNAWGRRRPDEPDDESC